MDELIKTLKLAQSLEQTRINKYQRYQKQISFSSGKKLLSFLIKAEKNHLNFLKEQEKRIKTNQRLFFSKLHQPELFLPDKESAIGEPISKLTKDLEILNFVKYMEEDDVDFYENLSKNSTDSKSKQLFINMRSIEKKHLGLINKTILLLKKKEKYLLNKKVN